MNICLGNGMCLFLVNNEYIRSDTFTCHYDCKPIQCPNYIICDNSFPKFFSFLHGVCLYCDQNFSNWNGILKTMDYLDCMICLKVDCTGIILQNCNHCLCVNCFKHCFAHLKCDVPKIQSIFDSYYENKNE